MFRSGIIALVPGLLLSSSVLAECRITFDNWSDDVFGDLYFQIETSPGSETYSEFLPLTDLGAADPEIGPGYYYQSDYDLSAITDGKAGVYDAGFYQLKNGAYEFVTRMDKPKIEVDDAGDCDYYYEWTGVTDAKNVAFKIYLSNDLSDQERQYFTTNTVTHSFGNDLLDDWQTAPMELGQDEKGTFLLRTVPFVASDIYEWNFKVQGQYLGAYQETTFGKQLQFSVSNSGFVEYLGEFITKPIEITLEPREFVTSVALTVIDETKSQYPLYIQASFINGWKGLNESECEANSVCAQLLATYVGKCGTLSAYQCLKQEHEIKDTVPEFIPMTQNADGSYTYTATNDVLGGITDGEWTIYRVVDNRKEVLPLLESLLWQPLTEETFYSN